jgi:Lar family restriction alleviation protein
MSEELKSCPFCGGTAALAEEGDRTRQYLVFCNSCGISTDADTRRERPVSDWNTRRPEPPRREAEQSEEQEIGNLCYKGNSVGYIYDKMTCYRDQVGMAFDALRMLGWKAGDENGNIERRKAIMAWAESKAESIAAKDAELARLRGELLDAQGAFVELWGVASGAEERFIDDTEALEWVDKFARKHDDEIARALTTSAALASPAEAGEKPCSCSVEGPCMEHSYTTPAAPSDAKAGERPCECGHYRHLHGQLPGNPVEEVCEGQQGSCVCVKYRPAAKPETKEDR